MTDNCKVCANSFAREHQGLLDDVCYLKNFAIVDKFVRVSPDDPISGYLGDKLVGVSGIDFYEATGVSGHVLVATLDYNLLDARYGGLKQTISLGLNSGVHNGYVSYNRLSNNIQSLSYNICGNPVSSFNFQVPINFDSGKAAALKIRWTTTEDVSGTAIFNIEYNSVGIDTQLNLFQSEIVSGISDGIALKMHEINLVLNTFIMNPEDQFLLKIQRLVDSPSDSVAAPLEIVGISIDYNF
jgi:hypothetical protein